MSVDGCIFCKIAAGKIGCKKLYEDSDVLAFLDINPVSDGHTLVIPKQHFNRLDECPRQILAKLSGCVAGIATAVIDAVGAEAYNVLCNNGRSAGQLVEHVHFHIIPRNSNDGVFSHWPSYEYQQGKADIIAEKIRDRL